MAWIKKFWVALSGAALAFLAIRAAAKVTEKKVIEKEARAMAKKEEIKGNTDKAAVHLSRANRARSEAKEAEDRTADLLTKSNTKEESFEQISSRWKSANRAKRVRKRSAK